MRGALVIALALAACGPKPNPDPVAEPEPGSEPGSEPDPGSEPESDPDPDPDPEPEVRGPRSEPENRFLTAHNEVRKQHCAAPLTWSADLAKVAQAWADQLRANDCAFEHSRSRYGENLAAGTSGALDAASSTAMWYREIDKYDFKRGGFSMATGHFTQVVWAQTARLGCGVSTCKGLDIIVCNYDPPGNVEGGYRTNVKPTGCTQ